MNNSLKYCIKKTICIYHTLNSIKLLFYLTSSKILNKIKTAFQKLNRAFVVTSTQNHQIIHLFNIVKILNKYKIFQDHRIRKFSNNINLRKLDFLIPVLIFLQFYNCYSYCLVTLIFSRQLNITPFSELV